VRRRDAKGDEVIVFTLRQVVEREVVTILHPVEDLLTGPGALTPAELVGALDRQFRARPVLPSAPEMGDDPPRRGTILVEPVQGKKLLLVRTNWLWQEEVHALFQDLRDRKR
jgi:hypothetical protein